MKIQLPGHMYATLSREGEPSNAYSISSTFSEDEEDILRQRRKYSKTEICD
jgi:hypothetical protein